MPIFKQIATYFSVYRKYIGRRLYIVFILSALAAIAEGFGITMLLPLIEVVGMDVRSGAGEDQTGISSFLNAIIAAFGIEGSLVGILLFIGVVFLLKGVILFLDNAYKSHLQSQLMYEIKSLMFAKYSVMDYRYYMERNTGHFINIINHQVLKLVSTFESYKHFLSTLITTLVYLAVAFVLAWNFALMAVFAGILLLILFRALNLFVHGISRKAAHEQGVLNAFLVQTIQAFKYLKSTSQVGHLGQSITDSIRKICAYMRSQGIAQSLTTAVTEPVSVFFILLVIIVQVSVLEAPLAPIFVALVLFNRAMGQLVGAQGAWQRTLNHIGSLEIVEQEFANLERNVEATGKDVLGPLHSGVEFRHVSFAYGSGSRDVLQDISLEIPANSTVAFVGESGAGKSTLVDMMTLMLRPKKGAIVIDGVSGSEVDLASWRGQIGYVSQETVVFDDTIANNISLWKDDYNKDPMARERIEFAARQAYAEKFIRDLPEQFNTVVGDRGVRLSGGQRQRLFLARELYKNPRLLILDEATSALDSESEKFIQESIECLKGSTTVVIIAHRLSTIRHADIIYVLENGRIVEQGTHEELMAGESGRFKQMAALQAMN